MRILAIRGKDLASLEGEFEVRLEADPLSTSGVFAIVGKTGAGKSTILDALSVALFDATPRLEARGGALVGHEGDPNRLPANDVRNLLRKGKGSASAEVEFIGIDGEVYRASWKTRRAHGRSNGAYQKPTMSLTRRATGEHVASGKKAVKAAIVEKLGLTFEQARRSMMLAQGEFAAFLEAKGDQRALLLERMTDTFIYSRLSTAAFERAKEARKHLDQVHARAGEHTPLTDEERVALGEEAKEKSERAKEAKKGLTALVAAERWHSSEGKLATEARQSMLHRREAIRAILEAADLRAELERTEAGEVHRSVVDRCVRADRKNKRTISLFEDAKATVTKAEVSKAKAKVAARDTRELADAAARALDEARPSLVHARELDAKLVPMEDAVAIRLAAVTELGAQGETMAIEDACLPDLIVEAGEQLVSAETWFAERAGSARQVKTWDRARAELIVLGELVDTLAAGQAERQRLEVEAARLGRIEHEAEVARKRTDVELEAAVTLVDTIIEEEARLFGERDLDAERGALIRLRSRIENLRRTAIAHAEVDAAVDALSGEIEVSEAAREKVEENASTLVAKRPALVAIRDAKRRAHRQARAQLDLSGHRAELRPGEPCPLCGSDEHPAAELAGISELVETFAGELAAAEAELGKLDVVVAETRASAEEHSRNGKKAQTQLDAQTKAQADLEAEWVSAVEALPLPGTPRDAADALEMLLAGQEGTERGLELAFAERSELSKVLGGVRNACGVARSRAGLAADRANQAQAAHLAITGELAGMISRVDARAQERAQREAVLDELLGAGWRARLAADASAIVAEGDALVVSWASWDQARDDARRRVHEHGARRAKIAVLFESLVPRFAMARAEGEEKARELDEVRAQRSALFGGRSISEVEGELARAREQRQHVAETTAEACRLEREALVKAAAIAKSAMEARDEAAKEREAAEEGLTTALEASGLTRAELERLLSHGLPWLEATRESLGGLDDTVKMANTLLEERTKKLVSHREARPEIGLDELDARIEAARDKSEIANEALVLVRTQLEVDKERRVKTAALFDALSAAEGEADLWQRMKTLIGSADGKLFRAFAQSLTLDILLGYANAQLDELYPRYQLQRVPGENLELQVLDRDMGDEVRGVRTLSGGETFLASLALALGLASLSASRTTIETLFIDEGFGALDPECLQLVVEVLDQLRASGRQVGVISHVDAIAERFTAQVRVEDLGSGRSRVRVFPEPSAEGAGDSRAA